MATNKVFAIQPPTNINVGAAPLAGFIYLHSTSKAFSIMDKPIAVVDDRRPSIMDLPAEIILMIADAIFHLPDFCDSIKPEFEIGYSSDWLSEPEWGDWDPSPDQGYRFQRFESWRVAMALAATCRRIHAIVNPLIYQYDAKYNNSSALFIASRSGNLRTVEYALSNGANVNGQDVSIFAESSYYKQMHDETLASRWKFPTELTPIFWSVIFGRIRVFERLKLAGSNLNTRIYDNRLGTTQKTTEGKCLHDSETEKSNLDKKSIIYSKDSLHLASSLSILYFALSSKVLEWSFFLQPNTSHPGPLTIQYERWRCQQRLGISFDEHSLSKWRFAPDSGPLSLTSLWSQDMIDTIWNHYNLDNVKRNRATIAYCLIMEGSPLITNEQAGLHAVHQAAADSNFTILELLLNEFEVDANLKMKGSSTPLHFLVTAADSDNWMKCLGLLLRHQADINFRDDDGDTALSFCMRRCRYNRYFTNEDDIRRSCFGRALLLIWLGAKCPEDVPGNVWHLDLDDDERCLFEMVSCKAKQRSEAFEGTGVHGSSLGDQDFDMQHDYCYLIVEWEYCEAMSRNYT